MSPWLAGAGVALACVVASLLVATRGDLANRVVGLQHASIAVTLALLLIAQELGRAFLFDTALTLALLSWPGTLAFVRFAERWE